uniref:Polyketide synthase n=1 Tax=Talaromyces purpureogenus TaxID=1266744 RepID=L8B2L5_TALPU|nr:polyketide synthase [Talaromyces purpureogenus]
MFSSSSPSSGSYTSPLETSISEKCSSDERFEPEPLRPQQTPIAVVGMGCRLPGHSSSPTALWDLLERGGVARNEPPPSRFSLDGHYDKANPGRPRTMKSPGGMFIEDTDPALFDGQFFNISRVECIAMDPQQRQMLEVAYECLENAGIPIEALSGTNTGVIVGTNFIDYGAIQHRDPEDTAESITIGLATALLSNRVSHFLNVHGPSMTVDTACSAGLVSLDVACRYLDTFQADSMLVGGANLWLTPEHNEEVGMMHVTQSGSGKSKSFDASADGYVKAEGVNCFFLKRLDDAVRNGDPIRAIIRGTAVNASGRTNGIANPSQDAQAAVTRQAFKNAGIGEEDFVKTQYLECHGTGTLAGDPIEVKGAASVFGKGRKPGQELIIGSIKSNIGHSEPAAGLSGLLKATMALEKAVIPGTPTFFVPNPNIDWKNLNVKASRISLPWPVTGTDNVRRASVNSFGFGGANAHAVVENDARSLSRHVSSYKQLTTDFFDDEDDDEEGDYNQNGETKADTPPTLLVFSANDQSSLQNYVKALNAHLQNPMVSIDLGDLAYTLSERRSRHYYGAFAMVRSSSQTINQETLIHGKRASSAPRIAFVFTGQGAQWSTMGADLVKTFPLAKSTIQDLDSVLQGLDDPPKWSLLEELTATRSAEALRQPEFSQPLVTALQIALLQVLDDWGIRPEAVVGHSSGEIAAAFAAGLITSSDAIRIAYYRGQASQKAAAPAEPLGMLAVGVGAQTIDKYLRHEEGKIQIACYNSPDSLTMSGTVSALEKLCVRLKQDGHFARMLLVDLAYHSDYMAEIGDIYEDMLLRDGIMANKSNQSEKTKAVRMFSSVTSKVVDPDVGLDAAYWKKNMVSPVQFASATSEVLTHTKATFLIELGPSNALSGPIAQIQKSLGKDSQYVSALKRNLEPTLSMYEAAGRLFLAGDQQVSLERVNRVDRQSAKVVIDLPNYAWNHSTRYWHETRASRDWRFKEFINHDLIGSKMSSVGWHAPIFKSVLKLANLPWLRDHKLGSDVVFPAAGYVAMAVEAVYQTAMITKWKKQAPSHYRFRLRDVRLLRALVLAEDKETRVTLALTPVKGGSTRSWYEYQMCSVQDGVDVDFVHSTGLVCVETDYQDTFKTVAPLELATSARIWYKTLAEMGYNFGPSFQKHLMVESTMGQRQSRSAINLEPPPSHPKGQSSYPLHPAVIDGCFQAATPSLWKGHLPQSGDPVLVPKTIDSIVIESGSVRKKRVPTEGIAYASANFIGVGSAENARNYATNVELYDPEDGALLFQMKGLASAEMETSDEEKRPHQFMRVVWDADVDMLMQAEPSLVNSWLASKTTQQVIDLIAHKKPGLSVLEMNLSPLDGSNLWMAQGGGEVENPVRSGCSKYHFAVRDPKTLLSAQELLSSRVPRPQFHLVMDISKPAAVAEPDSIDLAIVNAGKEETVEVDATLQSIVTSVKEGGFIVASGLSETALSQLGKMIALNGDVCICRVEKETKAVNGTPQAPVAHISLLDTASQESCSKEMTEVLDALAAKQWPIKAHPNPLQEISSNASVVVVLDELFSSIMDGLNDRQWELLKHLIKAQCPLLWITSRTSDPTRAAIVGFLSTIRSEEQIPLFTLDVENTSGNATIDAISACLKKVQDIISKKAVDSRAATDYDFVERGGVISISRVYTDSDLTTRQNDEPSARRTEMADLHACETLVQLRCERLGNLDAVHFGEVDAEPIPLSDGMVEVEIYAAGLNYKDVVVTMGIIPGDETALGHEAAGVVTKVSPGVSGLSVGERVVVFGKGSFANRTQTTPARVHRIPDDMTFEEAATLPIVYLTGIHSLLDHGNLSAGKSVLIHSAAGGVGIAAIQLAQYVGAEVFVTVGTPEKREFLKSAFGLADDRIFNSRNTEFGDQVLAATNGKGMDVVLNSLVGDMLDESFRILADGGIMVELGKRDVLDRNNLPMAPFDRNSSFRAVDLSPEKASDALVSRLMSKLFELINGGFIKPITPIHKFSWTDIPAAFRFLRPGTHIGKVVLSQDGPKPKVEVPIRRAPENLGLRADGCYLIVSSLRGLCGSLAIYLAQQGAKHLAVMSRSGYADEKSRYVIKQINALGAHIDLLTADVTIATDVKKAMQQTAVPIVGIIQGAMVLRDRPFESMTLAEYHEALQCKIRGTWNLHEAAESLGLNLDSFTLLSSLSGIIGHVAQANYAAGNVFLDAFAAWRQSRGQPACSIDLGISEDAGVIAESAKLQNSTDSRMYKGLNEGQLRKILYFALLQQRKKQNTLGLAAARELKHSPMITGLTAPQPDDSVLKTDARFSPLFTGQRESQELASSSAGDDNANTDVQALFLLLRTESADPAARLKATVDVVNGCFMRVLRLSEPMDPGRPISVYGTDSLAAVEVRNWVRTELGCLVTTLDIMNAASLTSFCEKILAKLLTPEH